MIEKLEKHIIGENTPRTVPLMVAPTTEQQIDKINKFVDAVNGILDYAPLEMAMKAEPAENGKCAKNAQDPYAEQRKWIGKLCRFWNEDNEPIISSLKDIQKYFSDAPFVDMSNGMHWQHCEPVLPDDDIIYKGDDK